VTQEYGHEEENIFVQKKLILIYQMRGWHWSPHDFVPFAAAVVDESSKPEEATASVVEVFPDLAASEVVFGSTCFHCMVGMVLQMLRGRWLFLDHWAELARLPVHRVR